MNLSRGDCETIQKKKKEEEGEGEDGGRRRGRYATSFFLFVDFCAFLISFWVNTLLTDTLIRLGLHALWAY